MLASPLSLRPTAALYPAHCVPAVWSMPAPGQERPQVLSRVDRVKPQPSPLGAFRGAVAPLGRMNGAMKQPELHPRRSHSANNSCTARLNPGRTTPPSSVSFPPSLVDWVGE